MYTGNELPDPDAERGEKRPRGIQKFAGQQIRKQKPTKTVKCRAKRHKDPVGERKPVSWDVAAKPIRNQNRRVSQQKEWSPKNCRPYGEQITDVASACVLIGVQLIVRAPARDSTKTKLAWRQSSSNRKLCWMSGARR